MKNKLIYFGICFLIYLSIYFVEEVIFTFLVALMGISSSIRVYTIFFLGLTLNPWITWKVANYIESYYLAHEWKDKEN